ncbi:hypothetical protein [Botrimarina mediterranea]|uniref:Uncharacterized protein n=1 Tax=Botrimarina mediterranea TaxID=2528022 RepID=A0A518K2A4_9BACT|nr:hypothetical protein [Botrimarina mediterranea]QDV71899.1 hypothetical protein Spa11_00680 [Botrimarina mediterranea]
MLTLRYVSLGMRTMLIVASLVAFLPYAEAEVTVHDELSRLLKRCTERFEGFRNLTADIEWIYESEGRTVDYMQHRSADEFGRFLSSVTRSVRGGADPQQDYIDLFDGGTSYLTTIMYDIPKHAHKGNDQVLEGIPAEMGLETTAIHTGLGPDGKDVVKNRLPHWPMLVDRFLLSALKSVDLSALETLPIELQSSGGITTIRLPSSTPGVSGAIKIVFESPKDGVIRSIERISAKGVREIYTVDKHFISGGILVPSVGSVSVDHPESGVKVFSWMYSASNIRINDPNFSDDTFQFKAGPYSLVYDNRSNVRLRAPKEGVDSKSLPTLVKLHTEDPTKLPPLIPDPGAVDLEAVEPRDPGRIRMLLLYVTVGVLLLSSTALIVQRIRR